MFGAYAKFWPVFGSCSPLFSLAVFTDTSRTPSIHPASSRALVASHRDARFAIQRILARSLARARARMKSALRFMRNAETRRRASARGRHHIMNNNRVQRRTLCLRRSLRRPCFLRAPSSPFPLCVRDLSVACSQFLPPLPSLILARFLSSSLFSRRSCRDAPALLLLSFLICSRHRERHLYRGGGVGMKLKLKYSMECRARPAF